AHHPLNRRARDGTSAWSMFLDLTALEGGTTSTTASTIRSTRGRASPRPTACRPATCCAVSTSAGTWSSSATRRCTRRSHSSRTARSTSARLAHARHRLFQRIAQHFDRNVWVNPESPSDRDGWQTVRYVRRLFPMFPLSLDGLTAAEQALIGARAA